MWCLLNPGFPKGASGGFLGNCDVSDTEDRALLGKLKYMVIILAGGWVVPRVPKDTDHQGS